MDALSDLEQRDVERHMTASDTVLFTFPNHYVLVARGALIKVLARNTGGDGGIELRYNDETTHDDHEVLATGGTIEGLRGFYGAYLQMKAAFALFGDDPIHHTLSTSRAWVADTDNRELEQFYWNECI